MFSVADVRPLFMAVESWTAPVFPEMDAANEIGSEDVRTIYVKRLICDASIGVYASEHHRTQQIVISLAVRISNPERSVGDCLSNVLDYSRLRSATLDIVATGHVNLQETLCEAIADFCLSQQHVQSVYVVIGKLEAFDDCESVGCELLRHRRPPVRRGSQGIA